MLAWADVRNGYQHDSITHALSVIERRGWESGAYEHRHRRTVAGAQPPILRRDLFIDAIVSWNFRHIVRLEKIRLFNAVNVELGYRALSILSPREVTTYEGH